MGKELQDLQRYPNAAAIVYGDGYGYAGIVRPKRPGRTETVRLLFPGGPVPGSAEHDAHIEAEKERARRWIAPGRGKASRATGKGNP